MLLETLDLRTNDILIYSQNRFNFNDSFKIIYKNEKVKRVRSISYFDVCTYVKDPSPKNLIVYRLLTNVNQLDAFSTKYGYFINVNGKVELVYFDPIFAIKDLRHLRFDFDPDKFRFKIQQLGLTSLTKKEPEVNSQSSGSTKYAEASFGEVYSFDLKAFEAQNQNDKIFADAIFAFEEVISEEEGIELAKQKETFKRNEAAGAKKYEAVDNFQIDEDKVPVKQNLNRVEAPSPEKIQDLREEIVDLLKHALGIKEEERNKLQVPSLKGKIELEAGSESAHLFDLFKTTIKSDQIPRNERDTVVLKFGKNRNDEVNPYR
ncbi:MAG: hypothetical protein Q8L04_00775 [Ignavibacteria bacterium]|nr:hypothetical protein [Ignavibacteria bacterium]